jgi:hypothetical protein
MILITAAKFIEAELASEFGQIPPCFLPIGNKRLLELQLNSITTDEPIYISIPESYEPKKYDSLLLSKYNAAFIKTPSNLSLGESILSCLTKIDCVNDSPLRILHGDTYIPDINWEIENTCSVNSTNENYLWASAKITNGCTSFYQKNIQNNTKIISGWFSFSSCRSFTEILKKQPSGFIDSLNTYSNKINNLDLIEHKIWLDFGHIHTYFKSKSYLTTQRSFNDLMITERYVTKGSDKVFKMKCESEWFKNIPNTLKTYTPRLINSDINTSRATYTIEYLYLSTLNELYTFGELPTQSWMKIFEACNNFLVECKRYKAPHPISKSVAHLYGEKNLNRIQQFANQSNCSIDTVCILNGTSLPSIREMIVHCNSLTHPTNQSDMSIMHGDFCFSNLLYDFRAQSIYCIDPRGHLNPEEPTIYGDQRYDIAKLYHSVIGNYDSIIAGRYTLSYHKNNFNFNFDNPRKDIQLLMIGMKIGGVEPHEIHPIMINLFFSMLPLHADNKERQYALLANAMSLYKEYIQ